MVQRPRFDLRSPSVEECRSVICLTRSSAFLMCGKTKWVRQRNGSAKLNRWTRSSGSECGYSLFVYPERGPYLRRRTDWVSRCPLTLAIGYSLIGSLSSKPSTGPTTGCNSSSSTSVLKHQQTVLGGVSQEVLIPSHGCYHRRTSCGVLRRGGNRVPGL